MAKENYDIKFKERLNEAMDFRNYSAYKLSKEIGLGEPVISSYRNGKSFPKLATAILIASVLKVDQNWLIKGKGQMETSDTDKDKLIEKLKYENKLLQEKNNYLEKIIDFEERLKDLEKFKDLVKFKIQIEEEIEKIENKTHA